MTVPVTGTPGTLMLGVVPYEKVALLTVVDAVIAALLITNVALWLMNGLCGPLPAIEPFALLYLGPGPGAPRIVHSGPPGIAFGWPGNCPNQYHELSCCLTTLQDPGPSTS